MDTSNIANIVEVVKEIDDLLCKKLVDMGIEERYAVISRVKKLSGKTKYYSSTFKPLEEFFTGKEEDADGYVINKCNLKAILNSATVCGSQRGITLDTQCTIVCTVDVVTSDSKPPSVKALAITKQGRWFLVYYSRSRESLQIPGTNAFEDEYTDISIADLSINEITYLLTAEVTEKIIDFFLYIRENEFEKMRKRLEDGLKNQDKIMVLRALVV